MPPLDLGRFEQMSARRLESQVEALAFAVTRAEEAEDAAQRIAERRYVQAEAWRQGFVAGLPAEETTRKGKPGAGEVWMHAGRKDHIWHFHIQPCCTAHIHPLHL